MGGPVRQHILNKFSDRFLSSLLIDYVERVSDLSLIRPDPDPTRSTPTAPMHKCIECAVSSVADSSLAAPNTNFELVFERVFERKDSEREVSEREVSERLR